MSKLNSIDCRRRWSVILTFLHNIIRLKTILSNFQGSQSTCHNVIRKEKYFNLIILDHNYYITWILLNIFSLKYIK